MGAVACLPTGPLETMVPSPYGETDGFKNMGGEEVRRGKDWK